MVGREEGACAGMGKMGKGCGRYRKESNTMLVLTGRNCLKRGKEGCEAQ